jgi:hypothetical protein
LTAPRSGASPSGTAVRREPRFAAAARPVGPCSGKMLSGTHE